MKFNYGLLALLFIFFIVQGSYSYSLPCKQGVYLEVGGGYNKDIRLTYSKIILTPPVAIASQREFKHKVSSITGSDLRKGTGYLWQINDHWLWSMGGSLSHINLTTKGKESVVDPNNITNKYAYKISAKSVNVIGRIIYTQEYWQYYGGLTVGMAKLRSYRYQRKDASHESYPNKTVSRLLYGVSVGVLRQISDNISTGFELSYIDANISSLDKRQIPAGNVQGHLKQKLHLLNAGVSLVYQF